MSKRITLTDREIEYIIQGLRFIQKESLPSFPVVIAGKQVLEDIINKLSPTKKDGNL